MIWTAMGALAVYAMACRRIGSVPPGSDASPGGKDLHAATQAPHPTAPRGFAALVQHAAASVLHLSANEPVRDGPGDWLGATAKPSFWDLGPDHDAGRIERGLGSGILIDHEGRVLTTSRVIGARTQLWARIHEERVAAQVLGCDPASDVALLRIPKAHTKELRPLRLGDSDRLAVGQWLLAVASPFGLGPRASAGIVSALPTTPVPVTPGGVWALVQTDFVTDAGNAGGAVLDTSGKLVGIATVPDHRPTNVGFVVPIRTAMRTIELFERPGSGQRGWAGLYVRAVTPRAAAAAGLTQVTGGLITTVVRGGPAERAGLRSGDIILALDGVAVQGPESLSSHLSSTGAGRTVLLDIWRSGKQRRVALKLRPVPP